MSATRWSIDLIDHTDLGFSKLRAGERVCTLLNPIRQVGIAHLGSGLGLTGSKAERSLPTTCGALLV